MSPAKCNIISPDVLRLVVPPPMRHLRALEPRNCLLVVLEEFGLDVEGARRAGAAAQRPECTSVSNGGGAAAEASDVDRGISRSLKIVFQQSIVLPNPSIVGKIPGEDVHLEGLQGGRT